MLNREELAKLQLDDGTAIWLWPDGTYLPVVRGGDGDEGSEGEGDEGDEGEEKPDADGKLSQEHVRKIATKQKREGRIAGRRDLIKSLGLETEDELTALLTKHREAETAKLSDADKAKQQAEAERTAAAAERAATKQERFDTRCERALQKAGVPEAIVEKTVKLVDIDWDTSEDVPDSTVFEDAVKELKKQMPQLFSTDSENGEGGGKPNSDPGKQPKGKGSADPHAEAREAFARRHPKEAAKS